MVSSSLSAQTPVPSAARFWRSGTLTAAAAATLVEAILIQQKKAFFTGGFLTDTHVAGAAEGALFLVISLLVDASLAGLVALLLIWATARLRLTPAARGVLVIAGAAAPVFAWDFIAYSLFTYLGDAFDLGLMFDLTGRNPDEVVAVASAHLATPLWLMAAGGAGLTLLVLAVNRWSRGPGARVRVGKRLAAAAALLVTTGVVTAAIASGASDTFEDGLRRKASGNTYARITERLTDFDRDGYGIGARTSDPAPFDGSIYPYAIDAPGNGIDENGVGGDLPADVEAYREVPFTAPWRHRPDIVFIVLESFRGDTLDATVDGRPVTPVLRALADDGISARAFSHNGYTIQSRYHLFSGSLASLRGDGTLIDDFKANGYEVAYFSGQDESFGGPENGVGFDRADVAYDARQDRKRRYSTFTTAGSLAVSHWTVSERLSAFLEGRDRSKPLFLYVNFHDTHYPYHHQDIAPVLCDTVVPQADIGPGTRQQLREMYLNTAANVDAAVGRTLEAVTRSLGRAPAVLVTADHGESLYEEGFLGHGYALNDVQTRIPFIARGLPMEIGEPVGQVELRDALRRALASDTPEAPARLVESSGKQVFQYLGNIRRPRQIAFTTAAGRTIYDFRSGRVILGDGTAHRPDSLDADDAARFRELIWYWESLILAREAVSPSGGSQ